MTSVRLPELRWLVIDPIHHWTGVKKASWNFTRLAESLEAFDALVISLYRYYQLDANLAVAIPIWPALHRHEITESSHQVTKLTLLVSLEVVLLLGSRDAVKKYYRRAEALVCQRTMRWYTTNG